MSQARLSARGVAAALRFHGSFSGSEQGAGEQSLASQAQASKALAAALASVNS